MSCNFVSFHETLNQPYFSRRLTLCVTEWRPFCDQSNALEVMVWLLVLQEPKKRNYFGLYTVRTYVFGRLLLTVTYKKIPEKRDTFLTFAILFFLARYSYNCLFIIMQIS